MRKQLYLIEILEYAMANVMCEYAPSESPINVSAGDEGECSQHQSFDRLSPNTKPFSGSESGSYYGSTTEPGRRIRRSESLLRQAAENVSRGQTFQTVSDMFQIPISTIR